MAEHHQSDDFSHWVRPAVAGSQVYRVPAHEGISVKLNQNESPFDLPAEAKRHLIERFLDEPWNRYPDEFGDQLRATIAERFDWTPDGVMLGNGSNELAQFIGFGLIRPTAPVVLLDPMFSLYAKIVALHEGVAHAVRAGRDFRTNPDQIIETARAVGAHLSIVATPNNPTGQAMAFDDLDRVADAVPGLLLIDEAYFEFVEDKPATELLRRHRNVLVLRTLSKSVGLAGLRMGYLLADPGLVSELLKARLPFMINRLTLLAADYLLRHDEFVAENVKLLKSGRDDLYRGLSQMEDVDVVPSSTNFVIFRTPLPAREIETGLAGRGVLVRDVSGYHGMDRFVRVNAGIPPENKAFLSALKAVLSDR